MTLEESCVCPVCASPAGAVVYDRALDPITRDVFAVRRCIACDVVYTHPRPRSMEKYYPREYRRYGPVTLRLLAYLYGRRVSRWVRGRPPGWVLEVGCGTGLMLEALRRRGWRVLGIERSEEAAEYGRRRYGLEIASIDVASLPSEARFDLIVLFHVLEHLADPVAVLSECARRLAPGGTVLVGVPNFASWQSRFGGPAWLHLDVPRHLVHFTPDTLRHTMARAGLHLAGCRFRSLEHDPYGWLETVITRLLGRQNTLTRYLMRVDRLDATVAAGLVLAAVLAIPAAMLAAVTWLARRGAIVEATAVASQFSGGRRVERAS